MIGGGRPRLHRQTRGAGAGELFRVNLEAETRPGGGLENLARVLQAEIASVAKDVHEGRQLFPRRGGNHVLADPAEVFLGAVLEFGGNGVGPDEGGHQFQGPLGAHRPNDAEKLQFGLEVQAVARLGLQGGGPGLQKAPGGEAQARGQFGLGGLADPMDGGQDAPAPGGEFRVTQALQASLEIGQARSGEHGMAVAVHESRKDHLPLGVDHRGPFGLGAGKDQFFYPGGQNGPVLDENRPLADKAQGGHFLAPPGMVLPREGQQLRAVLDQKRGLAHRADSTKLPPWRNRGRGAILINGRNTPMIPAMTSAFLRSFLLPAAFACGRRSRCRRPSTARTNRTSAPCNTPANDESSLSTIGS